MENQNQLLLNGFPEIENGNWSAGIAFWNVSLTNDWSVFGFKEFSLQSLGDIFRSTKLWLLFFVHSDCLFTF